MDFRHDWKKIQVLMRSNSYKRLQRKHSDVNREQKRRERENKKAADDRKQQCLPTSGTSSPVMGPKLDSSEGALFILWRRKTVFNPGRRHQLSRTTHSATLNISGTWTYLPRDHVL